MGLFRLAPILFCLLGLLLAPGAQGARPGPEPAFPALDWLEFSRETRDYWEILPHDGTGNWLRARPRRGSPRYRVVALIAKKSSSYSLALDKILTVFAHKNFPAELEIANMDKDDGLAAKALAQAEGSGSQLILSIGSEAADYLSRHYHHGRIPVVTAVNKDPVLLGQIENGAGGRDGNIAYTSLNLPLPVYLDYLRALRPGLKAVALLYDREHRQVMATEVQPTRKILAQAGIKVVDVAVAGDEGAAEQLARRMPAAVGELRALDPGLDKVLFWMTSSTAVFSHMRSVNAHSGRIPVVASIPNAVVEGEDSAVLGIGIDRRSNAHQAALYAMEILARGTPPGRLEVGVVTPPDIAINFQVARRIGLRIPFRFLENASFVYDPAGRMVRDFGLKAAH